MENKKNILKVIVGSQAHGLAGPDSDFDYRGVYILPTSVFLTVPIKKVSGTHWIEGKEDDTSWELGHFLDMAIHCNPTILETFLAPTIGHITRDYTYEDSLADSLRKLFPYIWNSKRVYDAFRGYAHNQQKKFLDKKDTRPHKYASAHLRVLYQATKLLETGTFPVDFRGTEIYDTLVRWKNRDYKLGEVMETVDEWDQRLTAAFEANPNKKADLEPVNEFLLKVRKENW